MEITFKYFNKGRKSFNLPRSGVRIINLRTLIKLLVDRTRLEKNLT